MSDGWQRLSPRMLLVHPVHEVLRQLPLVIGGFVLGSTTGDPSWVVFALAATVLIGVARWATTSYRIDAGPGGQVRLRAGLLRRSVVAVPRNRIRSVSTDARLLHRLLGLTVLRVATGKTGQSAVLVLDAVESDRVPGLRKILLAESAPAPEKRRATVLARWQPSWLRYSPLSLSGLLTLAGVAVAAGQTGLADALVRSRLGRAGQDLVVRWGTVTATAVVVTAVLLVAVLLAVGRSLVVYGNLVLTRRSGVLHLRYGLARVRAETFDLRRLRGGTLREPLLVRAVGGARLDAVMTGVTGVGEASLLLPPCPLRTAERVLTGLVGDAEVVSGVLRGHGPAAARRRWSRALVLPALAAVVLVVAGAPLWWWPIWVAVTAGAAWLAVDRVRALGHRVSADWLVTRAGSLERRRDCVATAGIIAWTVRQSYFQRRVKVATVVAATAAGVKAYRLIDVPEQWAWTIAATASPWLAESAWATRGGSAARGVNS